MYFGKKFVLLMCRLEFCFVHITLQRNYLQITKGHNSARNVDGVTTFSAYHLMMFFYLFKVFQYL